MSRGDEIEPGEPEKRKPSRPRGDEIESGAPEKRKSWKDYEDDEPDERDDERLARKKSPKRSGVVMTVGILAIIFGSLNLLCGVCGSFGGLCFTGGMPVFQDFMKQVAAKDPNLANDPKLAKQLQEMEKAQPAGPLMIGEGIFNFLRGTGLLVGGILVLRRVNFGRYLTLGMCVFGILGAVVDNIIGFAIGLYTVQAGVMAGAGFCLGLAFTVFAFVVLLNPRYAKEFARA
jgi:hypothetical protein